MAYWSYSCGIKGVSRVRVYERSVSSTLYIEWHVRGRRYQRALKTGLEGYSVTDKRLAMRMAHELARRLEQESNRLAERSVFGHVSDKTLGELANAYHMAKEADWSEHHRKAQRRFRDFWLDAFGADCPLTSIVDGTVEEIAKGLDVSAETRRKYLLWMTATFRFARRKLKWLVEGQDLTAVDMPRPDSETPKAYSLDEARRLLHALEDVGERAAWMGHVIFQTGRRPKALRQLRKADVDVRDDHSLLAFRSDNDKASKASVVPVVHKAHELTVSLMETPGAYVLGTEPPDETMALRTWLRVAEKAAGVPHVKNRGWYGLKRRYAGEAREMPGYDMQAGVNKDTLDKHYRPDDLHRKRAVARYMAELTEGEGS